MQHIMNDDEYAEYIRNKLYIDVSKHNEKIIEKHFSNKCNRITCGYCDNCPIEDTSKTLGESQTCMAGLSKRFSK